MDVSNTNFGAPEGAGWLLTHSNYSASYVYAADYTGALKRGLAAINSRGISPTFYIDANLLYVSGNGTEESPYKIQ